MIGVLRAGDGIADVAVTADDQVGRADFRSEGWLVGEAEAAGGRVILGSALKEDVAEEGDTGGLNRSGREEMNVRDGSGVGCDVVSDGEAGDV